ncbi:MAG: endonuclease III [Acidimicrobiales bacterium]
MAGPRTLAGRARAIAVRLAEEYPEARCELDHSSPFELLAATILSAQCTDARVNQVTPVLFARYPTPAELAAADPAELEAIVRSTGFYAAKARNLIGMAAGVVDRFGGEVPRRLEDLVTLPGVGRKTANVVRTVAFGLPGLPVDTHVQRLAVRLGLTGATDPTEIERELGILLSARARGPFGLRLILHGRRVCAARAPRCAECALAGLCPSAGILGRPPVARRVAAN